MFGTYMLLGVWCIYSNDGAIVMCMLQSISCYSLAFYTLFQIKNEKIFQWKMSHSRITQSANCKQCFMPGLHSHLGYSSRFLAWMRRSTHEFRHSHSRARIIDNEARHSRHSCFLWLGTDLPTCLWELRDEMRTSQEWGRRDECTLYTFSLMLSPRECKLGITHYSFIRRLKLFALSDGKWTNDKNKTNLDCNKLYLWHVQFHLHKFLYGYRDFAVLGPAFTLLL